MNNQPLLLPCDLCGGENIQPNIPAWTCGTCGKTYLKGSTLAYMPVSASPVTRSAEVEQDLAIAQAWAAQTKYDDHPKGPMQITRVARTLCAYIAQLEASQPKPDPVDLLGAEDGENTSIIREGGSARVVPLTAPKPQSDVGLREALKVAHKALSKAALAIPSDEEECADVYDARAVVEAALSRQAPLPTSGAVEAFRQIVEWAEKVLPVEADLYAEFPKGSDNAIKVNQLGSALRLIRDYSNAAIKAQPPAADGKLKGENK